MTVTDCADAHSAPATVVADLGRWAKMQERTDTPSAALWCAAYNGDTALVSRLIAEGVDINVWDRHGRNALTLACERGHLEVVRLLVNSGAWVDPFEDYDGYMTPLMCAAQTGRIEIVEHLLDHGANPALFGGPSRATAEHYARIDSPSSPFLAAILRRAEDEWRKTHRS